MAPELAFSQAASAVALPVLRNQSGAGANRSELRLDLAHVYARSLETSVAYAPSPEDSSPCSLGQCQSRVERSERTSGRDHSSVADVPVVLNHAPAAPWARKARATGDMTDVEAGSIDELSKVRVLLEAWSFFDTWGPCSQCAGGLQLLASP